MSARHGGLLQPWLLGVTRLIGVVVTELTGRIPEYAELQEDALCVRKLRGRYQPQKKYIAYEDINGIHVRGDSTFDIAYAGFGFWTRQPAKRHELVRVDDPDGFLEDLQTRVEKRTGGRVDVG